MHSIDLKPEQFSGYPPEARKLATTHLAALQRLPVSFLPSLLREVIDYDFKFPAERKAIEKELANLSALSAEQTKDWFQGFTQIRLSSQLEQFDWVNAPAQFVEQLSAYLWTTHQLDAFRVAALAYAERLRAAVPPESPAMPRLGIAVIGQGVTTPDEPLFRKLRPYGVYFSRVQPENGLKQLLDAVAARAKAHPAARPLVHRWRARSGLRRPAYLRLLSCVRSGAISLVEQNTRGDRAARHGTGDAANAAGADTASGSWCGAGGGARLERQRGETGGAVLDRFQVKLLTEGSGTQVFSTTFAQWAAREALRRAQPLTLLVRFARDNDRSP